MLTWEEAVRKMTGLPAATIGMVDRGFVAPGMIADLVVKKKLNVRATERLVTGHLSGRTTTKATSGGSLPPQVESYIRQIQDDLRGRFSTNVAITHGEKKGKIEIEYYGNDDLGRILELLGIKPE